MAVPLRALDPQGAVDLIAEECFPDRPDSSVGLEIEFLCAADPWSDHAVGHEAVRRAATVALPGGARITWEPGGQLELSGAAPPDARRAVDAARADIDALGPAMDAAGIHLLPIAMEPSRLPRRVLHDARYQAMEAYFDRDGPSGRRMMTATASLQVNLGLADRGAGDRWRVVHAIGPALVAAFANSPIAGGGPTGWRSSRFANWLLIDPTRTAPVEPGGRVDAWAAAAMRARVMLVRCANGRYQPMLEPVPFGEWVSGGHELGWPDRSDLIYHLTTLFPPVRPRGWLEVRYLDAGPYWDVAALVLDALTREPAAGQAAIDACTGTESAWLAAARYGCADETLASAARAVLHVASAAIEPRDADGAAACREYADRFPARRRCPADELLEAWTQRHRMPATAMGAG